MRRNTIPLALLGVMLLALLIAGQAAPPASAQTETSPAPTPEVSPASLPALTTTLTIDAPATSGWRQKVRVTGSLTTSQGPLPGRRVLLKRAVGSHGFSLFKTLTTNDSGGFSATVAHERITRYQAFYSGEEDTLPDRTPVAVVKPRAYLTRLKHRVKAPAPGDSFPVRGYLKPRHAARRHSVLLIAYRKQSGVWVRRRSVRAANANHSSYTRFAGSLPFAYAGSWKVVAYHSDWDHAPSKGAASYFKVTDWKRRYRGRRVRGIRTSKKLVALTFDDGPNGRTERICGILERYGGRGTFFFVGRLADRGYRSQLRRVYWRGHEVANHTWSHQMLSGRSYSYCYGQLSSTRRVISTSTGRRPNWARAMGGGIDSTGMRAVKANGELYCNWSIDSYDSHQRWSPPGAIYRNVISHVRPGSVILLHQTHPESVTALPRICAELRRRGYKMVTLSELAAAGSPR